MSRVASHVAVGKSLSTIAFTVISLGHLVAFVIIRNVVEVTFVVVLVFGDEQAGFPVSGTGLGIPTKPQCFFACQGVGIDGTHITDGTSYTVHQAFVGIIPQSDITS